MVLVKVPIKVHKLVLAFHFEYFKSMFTSGLTESTAAEVHLPFVGPEDLMLMLNYAYTGQANFVPENVFRMAVMANYFGSENVINRCCKFIKKFIHFNNCV